MTSSPSTEREVRDTDILNTYRTTGRYSDRYKTLMQESPPPPKSPVHFDSLIREQSMEKVTDWQRRLSDRVDAAIEQLRPTEETRKKKEVPRYMQSTQSHEVRVQTKRADPLGVRAGGGIKKRVGTSKIPQFKSTTDINAIDDIQGEMAPDDVYIPMAARIKLFERGLGNGANKPAPTISTTSTTSTSSTNRYRPNTNGTNGNHTSSNSTKRNGHIPTQPIKRSNTNKPADDHTSVVREKSTELKPIRKSISSSTLEVKPFKFATSERALHHEQVFKDRLKLWQVKDKEHQKNDKIRELKRKSSSLLNEKSKVRRTH
ncbi:hypothetical protein K501DRAFT_329524 [Backusella circina FSU 941]|nr:hypothetical protein K501DRAFT_329524 [Backusella circina FSU 941]